MNPKISYWVDSNNIICKVNDAWDTVMDIESWSDRASSQGIIGKNLMEFICDDVTRMYVATMIESVRLTSKPLSKPYRCDAPNKKRFMQMTITPAEGEISQLCVSHELLREEPLNQPVFFEHIPRLANKASSGPISDNRTNLAIYMIRCSICNRLKMLNSEQWFEIEDSSHLAIDDNEPLKVVYGVCAHCLAVLKKQKSTEISQGD